MSKQKTYQLEEEYFLQFRELVSNAQYCIIDFYLHIHIQIHIHIEKMRK